MAKRQFPYQQNAPRPARRQGLLENKENITPDGGGNYKEPLRYRDCKDLKSRYLTAKKKRGSMNSWRSIMRQFDRIPYRDKKTGEIMPCHGLLRADVDRATTVYVDYATERPQWFRLTTDHGDVEGQAALFSDHITTAFHKYCIKRWKKKFSLVLLGVRDMLLFSKGLFTFLNRKSCYPEQTPIENVWPDENAGMFPDTFDLVFVRKRYTAVDLFRKVETDEGAARFGWRRDAVLRCLRATNQDWKDVSTERIYTDFSQGKVGAAQQDFLIDCVVAYVKEYHDGEDEASVSEFIFPEVGDIPKPTDRGGVKKTNEDLSNYLLYKPQAAKCMDEVISLVAHTVCNNFYEDPSFAQLCYVGAKTYDIVMNRILQAIEDNMRVYLKSSNSEVFQKLQRMRHANFQVLEPSVDLVQEKIQRPVQDAMGVLQLALNHHNSRVGQYETGALGNTAQYKTAKQAAIDLSESTRISSAQLKIFNAFMTMMGEQIYRRFTSLEERNEYEQKQFEKFKKYLNSHKVPPEAWDPENCLVESISDLAAGSPAARMQAATVVMEALQTPAASIGERQAQRDLIASVKGIDAVRTYLPDDVDIGAINEDSLIGLENDSLSVPGVNPANAPVVSTHLHMRHIPAHIADAKASLQMSMSLLQGMGQLNPEDAGIHLKTVQDTLMGVDNKLAHARAHIQMAARTKSQKQQVMLKQFDQQIQEINKLQDRVEKSVAQIQQQRLEQASQDSAQNPEVAQKQRMYDLEFEHARRMNELDVQRSEQKAEQLANHSAMRQQLDNTLKTVKTQADIQHDAMKAEAKTVEILGQRVKQKQQSNGSSKKSSK